MVLQLKSSAFTNDERLPLRYTGEGEDVSPPLEWSGLPEGTAELALICEDPHASRPEPWSHWLIYNLDPKLNGLEEGVEPIAKPFGPRGASQGRNTWGRDGYGGPTPPRGSGKHQYIFTLYALNTPTKLEPGALRSALLKAMEGKILARARIVATYER